MKKQTTVRISASTREVLRDIQVALDSTVDDTIRLLLDRVDIAKLIRDCRPMGLDRIREIANQTVQDLAANRWGDSKP